MKKYNLFLLITCFLITILSAQSIQWGEEIGKGGGSSGIHHIVGSIGDQTLAEYFFEAKSFNGTSLGKNKSSLVLFDRNNSLIKSEELNFKVGKNSLNYRSLEMLNGRLYAICDFSNKKLMKKLLFAIELDTKTLKPLGTPQKIAETFIEKAKVSLRTGFYIPEGNFMKIVSNNTSYMAILSSINTEEDKTNVYNLAIYNERLELVWEKRITKDGKNGAFFISSMVLDDLGNFYYLVAKSLSDEEKAINSQSIRAYRNNGNESKNYDLKTAKGWVNLYPRLTIGNNNDVIYTSLLGVFNKTEKGRVKSTEMEGIKYLVLNGETFEIKHENEVVFSPSTREEIMDVKMKKGHYKPFLRFTLSDVRITENNEIFVLGEQLLTTEVQGTLPNSEPSYFTANYLHYQDIFIWKIIPDKGLAWGNKINKNQTITSWFPSGGGHTYSYFIDFPNYLRRLGGSYFSSLDDNGIHILYNEKRTELDDDKGKIAPEWIYAYIDTKGDINNRLLTQNIPPKATLIPGNSRKLSPDNIIIIANQKKKYQVGSVSFD